MKTKNKKPKITNSMSKNQLLKELEAIQGRIQKLWHSIGTDDGLHCQTALREMADLERKIENDVIQPVKSK